MAFGLGACGAQAPDVPEVRPQSLPVELEQRVLSAAFSDLGRKLPLPVPYCVVIERARNIAAPDSTYLAGIRTQRQLLPRSACPPTYGSMVRYVDSAGQPIGPQRPPGYIDPYDLTVAAPVPVTPRLAAVRIHAWQGPHFWVIYCDVAVAEGGFARCGVVREGDS
jgi:hypothetical protein